MGGRDVPTAYTVACHLFRVRPHSHPTDALNLGHGICRSGASWPRLPWGWRCTHPGDCLIAVTFLEDQGINCLRNHVINMLDRRCHSVFN